MSLNPADYRARVGIGGRIARPDADVARIIELRNQGRTHREIGAEVGLSRWQVRDVLRGIAANSTRMGPRPRRQERLTGELRIDRNCLRCERKFVTDTKVLRLCPNCRAYATEAGI